MANMGHHGERMSDFEERLDEPVDEAAFTQPLQPEQPEAVQVAYSARCDFCGVSVPMRRAEVPGGSFWGLEAMDAGAGSDHLATWCHVCGPRHRKDEWRLAHG